MNQRIKELAEQAGFADKGNNITAYLNFDHEKFAKLIIREAAQFVSGSAEVYTQAEQDACVRAAIGLKKYFGLHGDY